MAKSTTMANKKTYKKNPGVDEKSRPQLGFSG
ncbi:hypothetical protein JOD25_001732 [Kurthia huakuii]|nr:hypothetical protein [Kurthia huakuii]